MGDYVLPVRVHLPVVVTLGVDPQVSSRGSARDGGIRSDHVDMHQWQRIGSSSSGASWSPTVNAGGAGEFDGPAGRCICLRTSAGRRRPVEPNPAIGLTSRGRSDGGHSVVPRGRRGRRSVFRTGGHGDVCGGNQHLGHAAPIDSTGVRPGGAGATLAGPTVWLCVVCGALMRGPGPAFSNRVKGTALLSRSDWWRENGDQGCPGQGRGPHQGSHH